MKKYDDISDELKQELVEAVASDPYELSPKTLYRNIANSTGSPESLAQIFEVSLHVIKLIMKENS